ncbi:UNVERIFIED_CONTAM: hypothetical protein GTU68_030638 [Idotea baltica]|nr:hypothetical protein [Idotea baltica]
MKIKKYQVDAFSKEIFGGNPAVVCPVDKFPNPLLMQQIASEHNLSETAFIVKSSNQNESAVKNAQFDLQKLARIDRRGVIITAKSESYDFVSRFFAPRFGVDEDPVTGSAHTLLIPFWANKLGKNELLAMQISKRGGILYCNYEYERVKIGGNAVLYSQGTIFI